MVSMDNIRKKAKDRNFYQIIFFLFIFFSILFLFSSLPRISFPLISSYILYLIVRPLVPLLTKRKIGRRLSITIVFILITIFLVYPLFKVTQVAILESKNFQYYIPKIETYVVEQIHATTGYIHAKFGYAVDDEYFRRGTIWIKDNIKELFLGLPNFVGTFIEWLLLILLFTFFLLRDGINMSKGFLKIVPNPLFENAYHLLHQFNKKIGDYFFAKFIEASCVGVIITSGLFILNLRFALIFGFVAAITNIIPYLGPVIGAIPAAVWAFSEYGVSSTAGGVLLVFIIANAVDMFILFPILVSKIVDIHILLVVLSIIIGSQHLGILGMIVSIPLAAMLQLLFLEIYASLYPRSRAKIRFT